MQIDSIVNLLGTATARQCISKLVALCLISGMGPRAAADELPSIPLRVIALKMESDNQSLDRRTLLSQKLAIVSERVGAGNVDLVVVPEYTFYSGFEQAPVKIVIDGLFYKVVSTGTAKSDEIVAAVAETRTWALKNDVNVVLGTVAELATAMENPTLPEDIVFNTQLIIDRLGRIVGFKRKVTEWNSSPNNMYSPSFPWVLPIKQKALETVRTFTLTNKNGITFVILPVICDERSDSDMLAKAAGANADLIVVSERDGSRPYEDLMMRIQRGVSGLALGSTWPTLIRDIFIKNYVVDSDIIKPGGWVVAADSSNSTSGGVFELNVPHAPAAVLNTSPDYIYARIHFQNRAESNNVAPTLTTISTVPSTSIFPQSTSIKSTIRDADAGPLNMVLSWSKVSGAGDITFSPSRVDNGISSSDFNATLPGPYIIRATLSDGMSDVQRDYPIAITDPSSSVNRAPAVSAGVSLKAKYPEVVTLQGVAIDDGRPRTGVPSVKWTSPYSPTAVSFTNSASAVTTVKPNRRGTFVLKLNASDSALSNSSYVSVTWN